MRLETQPPKIESMIGGINLSREDQLNDYNNLMEKILQSGLLNEITYTAFLHLKDFPGDSPLLALQIACKDWDLI
jgi:hypothetical protein